MCTSSNPITRPPRHHLHQPMATTLSPLFLLLTVSVTTSAARIIQLPAYDEDLRCDSWRFSVETNDAGAWTSVPESCIEYVEKYMTGDHYRYDLEAVASDSLTFAKTVEVDGDGKEAWVFDVDETLLSNLPYYAAHCFGAEPFSELSFNEWVDLAEAPALPASLKLYNELKQLGFTIFLLTGRDEHQRNVTIKNLQSAGYKGFQRLILRQATDKGKPAILYKSQRRSELINGGYKIRGSSGDQWSDLWGFAIAERLFKLPNPMYYIS